MAKLNGSQVRVEQGKLSDVLPDSHNANKHKVRGAATLEKSLRKGGFFRPTAAFGKGVDKPVMGAGNLTQETAISIGMDEAIFIYTDGTKPIVHVRTDIEPGSKEAQRLALEDNRSAELSLDWDVEVLAGFDADVLGDLWTGEELSDLGQQWADDKTDNNKAGLTPPTNLEYRIVVDCTSEEHQTELLERFEAEGIVCRALIS